MGLGQSGKSNTEYIRCKRCNRCMFISIHNKTVIDLIRKDDQFMFSCNICDLLQDLLRIYCTCRIIRVNDNDRLGPWCDLALDILNIRIPVRLFITDIMNYISACQCCSSCPQRIIGRRNQDLIPVIKQCLHTKVDQLTDTISCINIINGNSRDPAKLCILHDRLPCGKNTLGIRISLGRTYIAQHIKNDFLRCRKSKRIRITYIKLQDLHSVLFHSGRLIYNRSSHVIQYVVKL